MPRREAPLNDDELLLKCRKGDTQAFHKLYARYNKVLFNFIYRMVNDYELAEDLLQDTFLRTLVKHYQPRGKLSNWLYRVAANLCLNELKKGRRTVQLKGDVSNPGDGPHKEAERRELSNKIQDAISALPAAQRAAFCLRHYHGFTYYQIASVLRCPLGTVKSRIHSAVRSLRIYLEEHYEV